MLTVSVFTVFCMCPLMSFVTTLLFQGAGEGLVAAVAFSLIPQLFPPRLVSKLFGAEAIVWAAAAFGGPVLAGIITELISWRAAFLVNLPIVIIVRAESPIRTLDDLIARARAQRDGLTYASPGVGHVTHLAPELLARRAGVRLTAVHYRSGADVLRSVLAGETEFSFPSVSTALPFIQQGQARAIAIGTPRPVPSLPGVPAVAAQFPGFEAMTWHGISGPAGMEAGLVQQINAVFRRIITSDEVKSFVETRQAAEVVAGTPAEFAALVAGDIAKWTPVIREGNIRAE